MSYSLDDFFTEYDNVPKTDIIDNIISQDDVNKLKNIIDEYDQNYILKQSLNEKAYKIIEYLLDHKDVNMNINIYNMPNYLFEKIIKHDSYIIDTSIMFIDNIINDPSKFIIYYENIAENEKKKVIKILQSKKMLPLELYPYLIDEINDYKTMDRYSTACNIIIQKMADKGYLPKGCDKIL